MSSLCALALIFSSGCTKLARLPASSHSTSDNFSTSSFNSGSFVLSQVLASQASAGTQYDLIGTSNQFDSFCGASPTSCLCEFQYVQGGVSQTVQVAPTYQEANLLRCPNQVSSGIASFNVRVITSDQANFTNTIQVNLNNGTYAGSTLYLDLSAMDSYVQARRFQCRHQEFIANPMDGGIIDPIQSDDPKVIYPFNYYTTNVSESLLQLQRLGNQTWQCTLTATQDRSLHWWANANVFSAAPCTDSFCAGDGEVMYPQTDLVSGKIPVTNPLSVGKRRASFWLSKQAYGVFQIALRAAIAPKDYVSANYGVIGYAAKPIPSASGSSVCPSITLPAKASWVKLWNFRATDITPPKKVTTSQAMGGVGIVCNANDASVFPTCWTGQTPGASDKFGFPLSSPDLVTGLASRVVAIPSQMGSNGANACYNIVSPQPTGDVWAPSPIAFGDPNNGGGTIAQIKSLPWNIYASASGAASVCSDPAETPKKWRINNAACPASGPMTSALPSATPYDNIITAAPLTPDNYTDQLFIVTDPSVDDSQMRNQSSSASQYRPVTYRSANDCTGASRSNGGAAGAPCALTKEIHWDVNVKEVGNATSADTYPLCVLQFYD